MRPVRPRQHLRLLSYSPNQNVGKRAQERVDCNKEKKGGGGRTWERGGDACIAETGAKSDGKRHLGK